MEQCIGLDMDEEGNPAVVVLRVNILGFEVVLAWPERKESDGSSS